MRAKGRGGLMGENEKGRKKRREREKEGCPSWGEGCLLVLREDGRP